MTAPQSVITDNERTVPVSRDLAYEIAAVSAAILDTEKEKTRDASKLEERIETLEAIFEDELDEKEEGATH